MSLVAHKVIDALFGVRGHLIAPPWELDKLITKEKRVELAEKILVAEKFDFGALMLEPHKTDLGRWVVPELSHDEKEFIAQGLVPLPFDLVWYEFVIGHSRSGLLIENLKDGTEWKLQQIDYVSTGVACTGIDIYGTLADLPISRVMGDAAYILDALPSQLMEALCFETQFPLAAYLTLMLLSKTTEIERGLVPIKLNKANVRRGYEQLPEHRIVHIVPERYCYERNTATGEQRRSPRLHWRRSHLRHLPNGKIVVIARMLVGRAELGEISHEYKIERSTL